MRAVAPVGVQLLAPMQVCGRGVVLGAKDLGGGKPRQILEILVLAAGRTVTKSHLAELLWPTHPPAATIATLESYVSVLRQHLAPVCGSRTALVRTGVGGYFIDPETVTVDVRVAAGLVDRSVGAPPAVEHRLLQQALTRFDTPLLSEDRDAPWAAEARADHARQLTRLLIRAAQAADAVGETATALDCVDRALREDPLVEAAWEVKLAVLEHAGRQAEALEAYGACRRLFERELGCAPGAALQAAFRRLLEGSVEHDDDLGALIGALLEVRHHANAEVLFSVAGQGAGTHVPGVPARVRAACRVLDDLLARALGPGTMEQLGAS